MIPIDSLVKTTSIAQEAVWPVSAPQGSAASVAVDTFSFNLMARILLMVRVAQEMWFARSGHAVITITAGRIARASRGRTRSSAIHQVATAVSSIVKLA